jgi:hypothetical protein
VSRCRTCTVPSRPSSGSLAVSQFQDQYGRVWQVVLESDPVYRRKPEDIGRRHTVPGSAMVPPSALGDHQLGSPARTCCRASTACRRQGQRQPGARLQHRSGPARPCRRWRGTRCRQASPSPGRVWPAPGRPQAGTSALAFALGLLAAFLVLAAQ